MNSVLKTIKERRSIREYSEEKVSEEALNIILEAATFAASAKNKQPWHFTAICNLEKINKLNQAVKEASQKPGFDFYKDFVTGNYSINFKTASLFIIVSVEKEALPLSLQDAALAINNMMLVSHSLGLGSCWINQLGAISDEPDFRKILTEFGVPENYTIAGSLVIGHLSKSLTPAPKRRENTINIIK